MARTAGNGNADVAGMAVAVNGHVRQKEIRSTRRSAHPGRCAVTGDHPAYVSGMEFTANGDIRDGVLHQENDHA